VAPATEAEKTNGQPPFTLSADELHRVIIDHLRQNFKDQSCPTRYEPGACGVIPTRNEPEGGWKRRLKG
jgi:hypothetical protein